MPPSASKSKYLFWLLNVLLGLAFIGDLFAPHYSSALDAALVILAAITTVLALQRQLPLQNVLPAVLAAGVIGGIAHGLSSNANLSMPFGPVAFKPAAGAKIFDFVPWTIPLLWIVAIFNSRGVARLILRPWRKIKNYGFWLMGLTAVLAMAFDMALEPFASYVKHFWYWQRTKIALNWQGTTLLNFFGWLFVSLLIMVIVTPSLIRKQPGSPTAPDIHPLVLWLGALLLFGIGSAGAGLRWAVAADTVIAAVTTVFAVRGAKW